MACGDKDIVRDDCLELYQKVCNVNGNIKLKLIQGMKHGYLNLDCKLGIKDAQYCVQDSINMIEELLII